MGDFTGRQAVLSPVAYFSTELRVNPSSISFAFEDRLGKVDFFMDELMSQQMDKMQIHLYQFFILTSDSWTLFTSIFPDSPPADLVNANVSKSSIASHT